jgi:rhamnosyltransferase
MDKISVFLLGSRGIPAKHGAYEQFCSKFCEKNSVNYSKLFVQSNSRDEHSYAGNVTKIFSRELKFIPGYQIIYDIHGILSYIRLSKKSDRAVMFGYTAAPFFWLTTLFGRKLIVNTDGYEYKRAKWGRAARVYLKICEIIVGISPHEIITDSTDIHEYFKSKYNKIGHVIAYGLDPLDEHLIPLIKGKYYHSIMRLEPENNFRMIIQAFLNSNCEADFYVIGPSTLEFVDFWKSLSLKKNRLGYQCEYLGPVYDRKRLQNIRFFSHGYVHGHSVGGMNPVLIESLVFNQHRLVYLTPHNFEVTGIKRAHYFIGETNLINLFDETSKAGVDDLSYLDERFSWDYILDAYNFLICQK